MQPIHLWRLFGMAQHGSALPDGGHPRNEEMPKLQETRFQDFGMQFGQVFMWKMFLLEMWRRAIRRRTSTLSRGARILLELSKSAMMGFRILRWYKLFGPSEVPRHVSAGGQILQCQI
jgi:hypothetical protein